ncbi:MAG: twin-arginine translocase TatA/TatE family subunit [Phycisphaerae bacterium]
MPIQTDILAFFQNLGMPEMIVIGVVALLIFGRRLPEVGRSVGKSIVEFKKGLRETDDEVKRIGRDDAPASDRPKQSVNDQTTAKTFNDPDHSGSSDARSN